MKKCRKILLCVAAALAVALPALAVFNEKDLGQTLSVLRYELDKEVTNLETRSSRINRKDRSQHSDMISMLKKCNELALMLYSQNQDCTFDITYALKEVTREYESFQNKRMPFDDIVVRLDLEIERYSRLIESLRRLPPQLKEVEDLPDSLAYHNDSLNVNMPLFRGMNRMRHAGDRGMAREGFRVVRDSLNANGRMHAFFLDDKGQADRDSCLKYAIVLLKSYSDIKDRIITDNSNYEDANDRLKESYDYAQERYRVLQKRMFTAGQDNYFRVLRTLPAYASRAFSDASDKYSSAFSPDGEISRSEWRGPMVIGFMLMVVGYLLVATVLSLLLSMLLRRSIKAFRTEDFARRRPVFTLLCGVVIFAVSVSVARLSVDHNFFKVASSLLLVFAWFLAAILLSLLIRIKPAKLRSSASLFMPVVLVGLLMISFRVIFIPNRMMNLLLPPLLLGFSIWQLVVCLRNAPKSEQIDAVMAWITFAVLAVSTIIAWAGFVFLSVLIVMWWLFQLSAIETIIAIDMLLEMYEKNRMKPRIDAWKASHKNSGPKTGRGDYIQLTWAYDLVQMTVMPIVAVLSLPLCVKMALDVFDLTEICHTIFYTTFFDFKDADGGEILKLSLYMIILAAALFFIFKFVNYLARAIYRDLKLSSIRRSNGKAHIHTNEVNLTLAYNVISIVVWGSYIIMVILLLRIPMGAISIVAAGLATGVGLALKDILNNFIYGIQLMSGRLRVGDWMECDGVRGKVTAISYQSTQIETTDGAVMSFLNTALFNKNFKNLTRNNSYELVKIGVGIGYGTDVQKARELLSDALQEACTKDSYGREIVDSKRGISVVFDEFGDSSVDLCVKQYVLVAERNGYIARAKEIIYNTLNSNGISIPFPQRDIHIRQD